jgi:hypothetical protein
MVEEEKEVEAGRLLPEEKQLMMEEVVVDHHLVEEGGHQTLAEEAEPTLHQVEVGEPMNQLGRKEVLGE